MVGQDLCTICSKQLGGCLLPASLCTRTVTIYLLHHGLLHGCRDSLPHHGLLHGCRDSLTMAAGTACPTMVCCMVVGTACPTMVCSRAAGTACPTTVCCMVVGTACLWLQGQPAPPWSAPGLQGNLCSGAWSTSCPPSALTVGSAELSLLSLAARCPYAGIFPLLNSVIPEALPPSLTGLPLASSGSV